MRFLTPPVWHEGMHLAQHHFQAQSRYFEDLNAFLASELLYRPYGIAECEFDGEALRNDVVSLLSARGVMPDGLVFDFPADRLPEAREIRSVFSPTLDRQRVLLAIPTLRAGQPNVAEESSSSTDGFRFRSRLRSMTDEVLGSDEKPVAFAEKNFRLLLEGEELPGMITLPLARVRRDGSGHFIFDPEYIPPSLHVGASRRLVELLGRLVGVIGSRLEALAVSRAAAPGELTAHWLAHTLGSALAPLTHHYTTRQAHPEQLYVELLRLAGALCTFSMSAHPRDLPPYDHDRPDECFGAIEGMIHDLVEVVTPTAGIRIPLRPTGESIHAGRVSDRRCLGGNTAWYLGIRSSESPAEVIERVPRLMKVCSSKFIERLVREAFPGLPLQHVDTPPPQIAPRVGTQYFLITTAGPCWSSIVETAEVGVYAPAAIADVELELVVSVERAGQR